MERIRFFFQLSILIILFGCRPTEGNLFLIPESFEGTIVVIFEQENGLEQQYSNGGKRLYHFSKNGILKTQFTKQFGIVDNEYWYVDNKGRKLKQLRVIYSHTQIDDYSDEVVAYNPQTIAVGHNYDKNGNLVHSTPPGLNILICPMNKIKTLSEKRFDAIRQAMKNIENN